MYRYSVRLDEGVRVGVRYLCYNCVFHEVRLFLNGCNGYFTRAGLTRRDRSNIMVQILCRFRMPHGGFLAECLAAMRS